MDKQRLDRGARAFMLLCEDMAEAARAGVYEESAFQERIGRRREHIAELAKRDDARLRELAEVMASVLTNLPRFNTPDGVEQIVTDSDRFKLIMNEVMGYGDGFSSTP